MNEVINIPQHLWHKSVIVRDRVRFIEGLKQGKLGEYYLVSEVKKPSMEGVFKDWKLIRFGLNCILNY